MKYDMSCFTIFFTTGTVKINELLEEAKNKCRVIINNRTNLNDSEREDIIHKLSIAAIKYYDLKQSPSSDYVFDWNNVLALDGNTGIYILYTYARIQSLINNSGICIGDIEKNDSDIVFSTFLENNLLLLLFKLPEMLGKFQDTLNPKLICDYLYELCDIYNNLYANNSILKAENNVKNTRLKLSLQTGKTINQCLEFLGIETVNKM